MTTNDKLSLEDSIKSFVEYLDGFDYESGDTPCLHLSWYRAGNNRRKKMKENGSSFVAMKCSVAIKRPDIEQAEADGYLFEHFTTTGEDLVNCVQECRKITSEYIEKVYG